MTLPKPKRTRLGTGFYQYSYGETGWITVMHHDRTNTWDFTVNRYAEYFEMEIDGKIQRFSKTASKISLGRGDSYKTMAEALTEARIYLLPQEEQDAIRQAERAEIEQTMQTLSARIASNTAFLDDLIARGVYEPDAKKRAALRRKETRERNNRLKAIGL